MKMHYERQAKNRKRASGKKKSKYQEYKENLDLKILLQQMEKDQIKKNKKEEEQNFGQGNAIHMLIKKLMPELSEKIHFKSA